MRTIEIPDHLFAELKNWGFAASGKNDFTFELDVTGSHMIARDYEGAQFELASSVYNKAEVGEHVRPFLAVALDVLLRAAGDKPHDSESER